MVIAFGFFAEIGVRQGLVIVNDAAATWERRSRPRRCSVILRR
jgi:hypothetical protein